MITTQFLKDNKDAWAIIAIFIWCAFNNKPFESRYYPIDEIENTDKLALLKVKFTTYYNKF